MNGNNDDSTFSRGSENLAEAILGDLLEISNNTDLMQHYENDSGSQVMTYNMRLGCEFVISEIQKKVDAVAHKFSCVAMKMNVTIDLESDVPALILIFDMEQQLMERTLLIQASNVDVFEYNSLFDRRYAKEEIARFGLIEKTVSSGQSITYYVRRY